MSGELMQFDQATLRWVRWIGGAAAVLLAGAIVTSELTWRGELAKAMAQAATSDQLTRIGDSYNARISRLEERMAAAEGERVRIIEEYRLYQHRIETVLGKLVSSGEQQAKQLARVEAYIETLKK